MVMGSVGVVWGWRWGWRTWEYCCLVVLCLIVILRSSFSHSEALLHLSFIHNNNFGTVKVQKTNDMVGMPSGIDHRGVLSPLAVVPLHHLRMPWIHATGTLRTNNGKTQWLSWWIVLPHCLCPSQAYTLLPYTFTIQPFHVTNDVPRLVLLTQSAVSY